MYRARQRIASALAPVFLSAARGATSQAFAHVMPPRFTRLLLACFVLAAPLLGCAGVSPRFDPVTQTALARDPMRVLETSNVRAYYAEGQKEQAERVVTRYEACLAELRGRARVHNGLADRKLEIVMPNVPLNNAYVQPAQPGLEPFVDVPSFATSPYFAEVGIPPDPVSIGCHELVHFVHLNQIRGIPRGIAAIFGEVYSPQSGLDPWFMEGLAVYYETKLGHGAGRLASPYFHGVLAAGVAGQTVTSSWLHADNREIPHGAQYLVGAHFVDYLARTYGEDRLWDLVERQSDEVGFIFGINGRFKNAFGKRLTTLVDDFGADMRARFPERARPATQSAGPIVGRDVRYARSANGYEALVASSLDAPPVLTVRAPNGEALLERNLVDVLPGRSLLTPDVPSVSGLSFTEDGRTLYFVALDTARVLEVAKLVRVDVPTGALTVVETDLRGSGGGVTPDGAAYVYARVDGDRASLAAYTFAERRVTLLADLGPRGYVITPRVSPRGDRILASMYERSAWGLALFDRTTGARIARVPSPPGQVLEATFATDDEVLFSAEHEGRLQIHAVTLSSGAIRVVTDAPYLAFSPFAAGDRVRFLNRVGWSWSLDEAPLRASATSAASDPPAAAPASAAAPDDAARPPPAPAMRDEPYSAWTGLLPPQAWGIEGEAAFGIWTRIGATTAGGDKLGYHRYFVHGGFVQGPNLPYGGAGYLNSQLAPWFVAINGDYTPAVSRVSTASSAGSSTTDLVSEEWGGTLTAFRTFYTSTIGFEADYLGYRRAGIPGFLEPVSLRRLFGAGMTASYSAFESTAYAGDRRGLLVEGRATMYPEQASDAGYAIGDGRAHVRIAMPLPLSARHTLRLDLTGRALAFAPTTLGLLRIGGTQASTSLDSAVTGLPPAQSFDEAVHGFETLALFGSRVGIAEATYRYPFIIDRGTAATLDIFPPTFLREVDLELFGLALSRFDRTPIGATAGTRLSLGVSLAGVPLVFYAQLSRRLTYDELTSLVLGTRLGF